MRRQHPALEYRARHLRHVLHGKGKLATSTPTPLLSRYTPLSSPPHTSPLTSCTAAPYSHPLSVFPQHLVCSSVFMSRDRHTQAADKAFVTFTSQRELLAALTMDRPRWNEKCHDDDECRDSPIAVSSAALLAATTLTQARRAAVLCNPRNLFS